MVLFVILLASLVSSAPLLQINQTSSVPSGNSTLLGHERAQGWVPASSIRSSWEILYTCLSALIACFIKFVPLNFPAYGDSKRIRYLRKLKWLIWTIFIPEIVVFRAWTQYQEAKRLKRKLDARWKEIPAGHKCTIYQGLGPKSAKSWSDREKSKNSVTTNKADQTADEETRSPASRWLCHLAVSGGLVIDVSDIDDELERVTLTPDGLLALAERGFFLSVSDRTLKELRKRDGVGQAYALWQLVWLLMTVLARWASNLPVSLLELNTFVNIIFALAFYAFWIRYSIDIAHPIVIDDTEIRDYVALFLTASKCLLSDVIFHVPKEKWTKKLSTAKEVNSCPKTRPIHKFDALVAISPGSLAEWHAKPTYSPAGAIELHQRGERVIESSQNVQIDLSGASSGSTDKEQRRWLLAGAAAFNESWELQSNRESYPSIVKIKFTAIGHKLERKALVVRITNITDKVGRYTQTVLFLSSALAIHGLLHLIAWNSSFPTKTERSLWRLACFGLILGFLPQIPAALESDIRRSRDPDEAQRNTTGKAISNLGSKIRTSSQFSCWTLILITSVSSAYLFVEGFLALRSSPVGVYERIIWSALLPSFS